MSVALSQIFTLVPLWQPGVEEGVKTPGEAEGLPAPEFPHFSVQELMEKGTLLLASSGKEFTKPTGILASSSEVKKARKDAMSRLGLDFLETVGGTDDIDLEKELAADEEDMNIDGENGVKTENAIKVEEGTPMDEDVKPIIQPEPIKIEKLETLQAGPSQSPTPALSPVPSNGPPAAEDISNLSARERNRLKRKRKGGNSAFVVATAPSTSSKYNAGPVAPPNKYVRISAPLLYTLTMRLGSVSSERIATHPRAARRVPNHPSMVVRRSSSTRPRAERSLRRRRSSRRRSMSSKDGGCGTAS